MKKIIIAALTFIVITSNSLFAQEEEANVSASFQDSVCKGNIVPIDQMSGGEVLYKPENLHGGRGPSFLVQNVNQRTHKRVLEIRNARCEPIAAFGLFATDQPYGSRYYSRSGGSGHSDQDLLNVAKLVGSSNILVEGINGTWIRVDNPLNREGHIRK